MCDCGCEGCSPKKPVLINENLAPKEILSEGLKYHMDNARPLTEHVYRAGSQKYFELWAEARALYTRGILEVQGDDLQVLTETDLGHYGMFEGKKVPLDFPIEDPKTKKVKTVRFGSGGLRAKINDKKARNAFAKRHKCSQKKDKTKAGYWSCRLPRYAKLLGLKSNFGGFW
jgi:hypothetical protein